MSCIVLAWQYKCISHEAIVGLVSFPDPVLKEGKGLVYIKHFWSAQDVACHVIVMTTHHLGMATHPPLSRADIV